MKKYFSLYQHCKYASGIDEGCIYNTLNGQMIRVDSITSRLLKESFYQIPHENDNEKLIKLVDAGLGDFYDYPTMQENYLKYENRQAKYSLMISNIVLNQVYLVTEPECNLCCEFCSEEEHVYTKTHCKKRVGFKKQLDTTAINTVLETCKKLGVDKVSIIGGNPFLDKDLIEQIADLAGDIRTLEIYANVLQIDDQTIDFLLESDIVLVAQIVQCSIDELMMLRTLIEKGINLRVDVLLWKKTEGLANDFCKQLLTFHKFRAGDIKISGLYNSEFSAKDFEPNKKQFHSFSAQTLEISEVYNTCLFGKIAIRLDGKVMPCPMMDNIILGDVTSQSLIDILTGEKYRNLIQLSRNKIEGCSVCAFKNNCMDCRALEYSKSGSLNRCAYCEVNERITCHAN